MADTTADAIRRLCSALVRDDFAYGTDRLTQIIGHAERMEAERDALHQRVERFRLALDDLAMRAAESTRGRCIDAEEAAAKHLHPGDLGDETVATISSKPTGQWGNVTHVARILIPDDERDGA